MPTSASVSLPPEIIEAILRLLPVKTLGRFKSVSKKWNSLLSNPQFIKTHLLQIRKLILVSDTTFLYSITINQLLPYLNSDDIPVNAKQLSFRSSPIRWEEILGSCNGLVLAKDEKHTIFLVNPTTQELWKIPLSPFALPKRESFVMYGFGYDSSTDDYKVVSLSYWDTDNEYNPDCIDTYVTVYSLRNNSWRMLRNSPYDHSVGHVISGVLVNQNLHWLTSTRPGYSSTIVAFSLADEEFNEIEWPDSIANDKAVFNELVVLGGKLGLFDTRLGNDLWVMEEYGVGKSWSKICIHGVEMHLVKPVCFVEGSSNQDIVFGDEEEVAVYNIDERRCRKVRIEDGPSQFTIGGTYVESLESAKCIEEHREGDHDTSKT